MYDIIKDRKIKVAIVGCGRIANNHFGSIEKHQESLELVGVCDTNANPTGITYPIPCNDDAIKTLQLLADYFQAAVTAGKAKSKVEKPADKDEK